MEAKPNTSDLASSLPYFHFQLRVTCSYQREDKFKYVQLRKSDHWKFNFFYIESVQNCLVQEHDLNQINLEMLQVFHPLVNPPWSIVS